MILERRTATSSDTAFARTTHHAAYRDVVSRQFGEWDEALQDRLFGEKWIPNQFEIVLCDGNPCGFLSIEDHPDHIYVRWIAITPPNFKDAALALASSTRRCSVGVKRGLRSGFKSSERTALSSSTAGLVSRNVARPRRISTWSGKPCRSA